MDTAIDRLHAASQKLDAAWKWHLECCKASDFMSEDAEQISRAFEDCEMLQQNLFDAIENANTDEDTLPMLLNAAAFEAAVNVFSNATGATVE